MKWKGNAESKYKVKISKLIMSIHVNDLWNYEKFYEKKFLHNIFFYFLKFLYKEKVVVSKYETCFTSCYNNS